VVDASLKMNWPRYSAWADVLVESSVDTTRAAGVTVATREGLAIASIIARPGGEAALSILLETRFGLLLPASPRVVRGAAHTCVWAGPGQWLLIAEQKEDFAVLANVAAVSDQSDGRAALRISGPNVRDMLAKGCMIDLHPAAFPTGAAAVTSIAHIGVHLWRVDEPHENEAIFDILVARSMTASFWAWANASAAEFGCRIAISR
jgi:methylglutamate dehydrogenase subunit D